MTTEEGARIIEQERRIEELEKQLKNSVQVVRCKYCTHYKSDGGVMMVCSVSDLYVNDDDYCSYGERKGR